ncbi:MFS transporter [Alicyclobacillus sp. SO9]|uniref:MFS transporter n=1 Tax=Alicyclobacillus sp. SO9 TaxID=2665646 RepID=UPI0018E85EE3|nr:MFS transporter [Alicyclobacillus sp. SO9]QQE80080.1 MFS transporter [Alicyclobacillus sp. SO9]
MSKEKTFKSRTIHLLGMAGLGRNVGYGANKVFTSPMLQNLHISQPLIGLILGLEGLLGLIMNPLAGWLSDHTTKPGFRRKIYVAICLPGAALAWLLFYFLHQPLLAMIVIVIFYLFQQTSMSPYQAWMPEVVPASKWGVASGYLNLWWLVGNLAAFLVIPMVWTFTHTGAFILTSAIMVLGGLTTVIGVPEAVVQKTDARNKPRFSYRTLRHRNLVLYFTVHFLSWLSYESMASFFTLFVLHVAHGKQIDAALAMALYTGTGIVTAFVVGKLYKRVSPKLMLSSALGLYGLVSLAGLFIHSMTGVYIVVAIEGVFWAVNLTVSFALVTDLLHQIVQNEKREEQLRGGLFGLNTLMEAAGLLIAAPLTGVVVSWSGSYSSMFLVSMTASVLAIVFVLRIRLSRSGDSQM